MPTPPGGTGSVTRCSPSRANEYSDRTLGLPHSCDKGHVNGAARRLPSGLKARLWRQLGRIDTVWGAGGALSALAGVRVT